MSGVTRFACSHWLVAAVFLWMLAPPPAFTAPKKKTPKPAEEQAPSPIPPKAEPVEPDAPPAHGPNVLLIIVDSLNDWVGWLGGDPQARTPNLDRLAHKGVRFTNAHCACALSNPSRTALLTGLAPWNSGVWGNEDDWRHSEPLAGKRTLPSFFHAHGYLTAASGKIFHASHGGPDGRLTGWSGGRRGFEQDGAWMERFPDGGAQIPDLPVHSGRNFNGLNTGAWDWGPIDAGDDAMDDAKVVQWATGFLKKKFDRSFFLAVGLDHLQPPWYTPKSYFDSFPAAEVKLPEVKAGDLADVPEAAKAYLKSDPTRRTLARSSAWPEAVRAYLAGLAFTDAMAGRLLDALETSPQRDNTIVCLMGDHGVYLGQKQRWGDGGLWEEASRVPLCIVAPGVCKADTVCAQPVSLTDIYATLAELAGLEKPSQTDGESLVPLLKEPGAKRERPAVTAMGSAEHPGYAVRSGRWSYIHYSDGSEELYDHDTDPLERRNMAKKPEVVDLKKVMASWVPESARGASRPASQVTVEHAADGSTTYLLAQGDHFDAKDSPDITGKTFQVDLEFDYRPDVDANSALISQGGPELGWALHLLDGKPAFTIQYSGLRTTMTATEPLQTGHIYLRALFAANGMLGLNASGLKEGARGYAPMEGGFPSQPEEGLSVGRSGGPLDAGDFPNSAPFDGNITKVLLRLLPP